MKILVGMSGGVDSSVAALILKQQGHEVIGATMAIWGTGGRAGDGMAQNNKHSCKNACYGPDEKEDIEQARQVCEQIGIPFYVFDCVGEYEKIVLDNFKKEYISGRTPNPCVWCNSLVKFGVLPELAKASGIEFDKFATGHYARLEDGGGKCILKRGFDPKKDQSYFIYRLKPEQLENIVLPLGGFTKDEIRAIAKENGLQTSDKPDSQDFYSGDYNELLEIQDKPGNIVDKDGQILGTHNGIWNYTIGQRKGIGIAAAEPLYVLELRKDTNEVVVGFADETWKRGLTANDLNWIVNPHPAAGLTSVGHLLPEGEGSFLTAKIRSTQSPVPVTVQVNGDEIAVEFEELQKSVTPGQSIVLYDGDIVLGGGIIDTVY
ncbi:MAG: tRNA 2-thiouridine(34) synthase MnmA [Heliobacteriaceae bacterium]|jgi:tRNA-specific 2-thiouridylase|nr:tRNA 2-thiouridine(34) synthase MnmA [Heliobacteriaceae bacterium]